MKSRRNKHKGDGEVRKLFMQQLINTLKDSEFMEGVMNELIELYSQNSDEQNELDFDESMLPDMLAVCVENEQYEIAARIHKQITKTETNVEAG
jgi:protein-arginine kinase activator protein McsA